MEEDFRKILVPVDFSTASFHAAEEAAIIAVKFRSEMHLLHIASTGPVSHWLQTRQQTEVELRHRMNRLETLKNNLEKKFILQVQTQVADGILKKIISDYTQEKGIDLVVVGRNKRPGWLEFLFDNTARDIINAVQCEVLSIYPESSCSNLKKIVLPVGLSIPKRKIRLAYELARKFAAHVYLVSLNSDRDSLSGESTRALMGAYQCLKEITNIPVDCKTVFGNNLAEASIRYAANIGADIILVNPGQESRLRRNFTKGWGNDILNHSTIPVLSIYSNN